LADIVLNTNVLVVLVDERYIRGIIERCDHLYVAACVWKREKSVFSHFINILDENAKRLQKNRKWHLENTEKIDIRPFYSIWRQFMKHFRGNRCDKEVVKLAFYRRFSKNQDVILVSDDPDITSLYHLFENYNIQVLGYEEERARIVDFTSCA